MHRQQPVSYRSYEYKKSSPHAILNRFAEDLALLPLQARSQESYWACVRQWAERFDRSPELVTAQELREYFIYLKTERRFSRQSSTQALCAVKLSTSCPPASIAHAVSAGCIQAGASSSTAYVPCSSSPRGFLPPSKRPGNLRTLARPPVTRSRHHRRRLSPRRCLAHTAARP